MVKMMKIEQNWQESLGAFLKTNHKNDTFGLLHEIERNKISNVSTSTQSHRMSGILHNVRTIHPVKPVQKTIYCFIKKIKPFGAIRAKCMLI